MAPFDPAAGQIFRANEWHTVQGAVARDIVNPADLSVVGRIAATPLPLAEEVAREARVAQATWKRTDAKTRAKLLHDVAHSIASSDFRDVARLMSLEMGKPYPEAVGELMNVAPAFRYFAEMARDDAGKLAGATQSGSFQYVRYEPYGVSLHIVPFNFPILLMSWTVAASLAAGNACIVKPAETTSLSTLAFMAHFAGSLPAALVSCLTGDAQLAQALIRSPSVHAVAFTGGVRGARAVALAAAEAFKPAIIEAGGNDAMIVSEHAPLDVAAAGAATAAFHLSGQVCTSAERLFVHGRVHDAFVEKLAAIARRLRIGPGLAESEIGPLVSEAARDRVIKLVGGAVEAGAIVVTGGGIPDGRRVGWYFEPTVLSGCRPEMAIMNEEIFGPVAAVCRVNTFEEAIELANRSPYGLGASVFTTDLKEAFAAAEMLEAGMVWVNNPLIDNDALPFGGWKCSGLGRELGRQGLDAFRQSKMVVIDPEPKAQDWWYPYPKEWFYSGSGRG